MNRVGPWSSLRNCMAARGQALQRGAGAETAVAATSPRRVIWRVAARDVHQAAEVRLGLRVAGQDIQIGDRRGLGFGEAFGVASLPSGKKNTRSGSAVRVDRPQKRRFCERSFSRAGRFKMGLTARFFEPCSTSKTAAAASRLHLRPIPRSAAYLPLYLLLELRGIGQHVALQYRRIALRRTK